MPRGQDQVAGGGHRGGWGLGRSSTDREIVRSLEGVHAPVRVLESKGDYGVEDRRDSKFQSLFIGVDEGGRVREPDKEVHDGGGLVAVEEGGEAEEEARFPPPSARLLLAQGLAKGLQEEGGEGEEEGGRRQALRPLPAERELRQVGGHDEPERGHQEEREAGQQPERVHDRGEAGRDQAGAVPARSGPHHEHPRPPGARGPRRWRPAARPLLHHRLEPQLDRARRTVGGREERPAPRRVARREEVRAEAEATLRPTVGTEAQFAGAEPLRPQAAAGLLPEEPRPVGEDLRAAGREVPGQAEAGRPPPPSHTPLQARPLVQLRELPGGGRAGVVREREPAAGLDPEVGLGPGQDHQAADSESEPARPVAGQVAQVPVLGLEPEVGGLRGRVELHTELEPEERVLADQLQERRVLPALAPRHRLPERGGLSKGRGHLREREITGRANLRRDALRGSRLEPRRGQERVSS